MVKLIESLWIGVHYLEIVYFHDPYPLVAKCVLTCLLKSSADEKGNVRVSFFRIITNVIMLHFTGSFVLRK